MFWLGYQDSWIWSKRDEPCIYKKMQGSMVLFLVLYVDDIILI